MKCLLARVGSGIYAIRINEVSEVMRPRRKIISRHGGKIWVDSEPGKGSTFHFTLSVQKGGWL